MLKYFLIGAVVCAAAVVTMAVSGCSSADKYRVDYCGQKDIYSGAHDRYKAGETVKLRYDMIATDTDYSFYLNGKSVNFEYLSDKNVFQISFVMPEYDVKLECNARNSMTAYIPEEQDDEKQPEETVMFDYHQTLPDGGSYALTLVWGVDGDVSYTRLDVARKEHAEAQVLKASYPAKFSAVVACRDIAEQNGFYSWDIREDAVVGNGDGTELTYLAESGSTVRISTEKMPPDGADAFDQIRAILEEYIQY